MQWRVPIGGQVQISLDSFGVNLYVATEAKGNISFHQISRSTGERVRHQKVLQSAVDSGSSEPGDVVEKEEIVRGYEYSKGQYVIIEPSELDNLRVLSKHTIAVSQFIDQAELNPEYVEKPYLSCRKRRTGGGILRGAPGAVEVRKSRNRQNCIFRQGACICNYSRRDRWVAT